LAVYGRLDDFAVASPSSGAYQKDGESAVSIRGTESGHDVNRVERAFLVASALAKHFIGNFLRDRRPDFNDLVCSARRW